MSELERFVRAQEHDHAYERAVAELRAGKKTGHWMWFIFPQLAGLGHSTMSRQYAILNLGEAQAYLRHPLLGARLLQCVGIVEGLRAGTAEEVFGVLDAMKLRSSMTLFLRARPSEVNFSEVLQLYFNGQPDQATDELLARPGTRS